jgi:hypothetical protein
VTRVRRVPKIRRLVDLPPSLVQYLETGQYTDFDDDSKMDVFQLAGAVLRGRFEHVREVWHEHGAALLADWLEEHPGSRPFCWWAVIAPEPRRVLVGAELTLAVAWPRYFAGETTWRWRHGLPGFIACRPRDLDGLPSVESQAVFLDRLGLLDAEERAAIKADAFEPEEINPFVHTNREELKP